MAIGAHPGYPDRDGFGRRDLAMGLDELRAAILAQVGALAAICRGRGAELRHVKLHGALYNRAAVDHRLAGCVVGAVRDFSSGLTLVGLAGSALLDEARSAGLQVAAEAFADRMYAADGTLRSRNLPGALHEEPAAVAEQAVSIVRDGRVRADDGTWIPVVADTLCLHGDAPGSGGQRAGGPTGVRGRGHPHRTTRARMTHRTVRIEPYGDAALLRHPRRHGR